MKVTVCDIAKKLGIHPSTVSLALNNSPKVAAATLKKVHGAAEEMGYQRNPYVSALMSARRNGKDPDNPPVIAVVTATDSPDELKARYNRSRFVDGCTSVAQSLGIKLEQFWIGEPEMSARRLNDIFYNRGIRGAVMIPAGKWREKMNHAWSEISVVSYGIYQLTPATDWVTADYYGNMEKTRRILSENAYERIGYIMDIPYPYKSDNRWLAAYMMLQRSLPESDRIEPWLDPAPSFDGFREWYERSKPDVIVCISPSNVIPWLEQLGLSVPEDISLVTLGTAKEEGEYSGIIENAFGCGKLALEMLLDRIHHNQFGQLDMPHHVTVGGHWNRGTTLRYR
ncbi:LacI family DNA-binding transcriptional regulator [Pontiellaceae bacterium B12227]|nr:LacI family DNA-binding transcriptional regulator [Pontiellaceae bacterium B12227]